MDTTPIPVVTQEIQIVDAQGHPRLLLSAKSGAPTIQLLDANGKVGAELSLTTDGHPLVKLSNPDATKPAAALEVDDKGAHVKFDHPDGASSYLFLNNAGGTGVVLIDTHGKRRFNAVVGADGTPRVERLGADGKVLP